MRKVLSVGLFLLSTPAMAQEDMVDKRLFNWRDCIQASFQFQKTKTQDLNLAAERSFRHCSIEEDALRAASASGMSAAVFEQFKAKAKQLLMQGK